MEGTRLLLLGLTFKENCPDLRNTRMVDIIAELAKYNVAVDVYDPQTNPDEAKNEYGIRTIDEPETNTYDGVILAAHRDFRERCFGSIRALGKAKRVPYDLKYLLPKASVDLRL